MRFRVLGPLTALSDGREVPLGGNKLRVALAGLLLRPGETVPVSRLAAWLWEGGPEDPDRAKATIHTYVNRLRHQLGRDVIRTVQDGYRAEVDAGSLDLLRFRELAGSGRRASAAGDLGTASRVLSEAIALWRGPVLSNVDSASLLRDEAEPLTEELLRVQEQWLDVGLQTGLHAELVVTLRELTRAHPLREPFWERLMLSLHRSGRHAEALQAYHALSTMLAEELGIDPGPSLRATYQAILTDDPSVGPPEAVRADPREEASSGPVPRQLRPDMPGFAGRRGELAELDLLLDDSSSPARSGPKIVSLQGTAGSGKTALAIHWAHRIRDRFPDGQLYLDLHGYGPEPPLDPAAALETLLRALGTPAGRIPAGLEERSALFRTLLAGRRILVLLDNAGSSEQIRPLMPGSGGMAVVTSRNQLRGLVVEYGARRVVLDQMPSGEAVELLAEVLGRDRVASAPEAVAEIVERCARLPLALRIFAERAARFPGVPLGRLVADLRDERTRLTALDTGDGDHTDLRMVFSWTYGALDPDSARLFRLLGLHPGPEVSTGAAAALTGGDLAGVTRLLDRLTADHLLRSRFPGRYDFHDLLRSYAAERAHEGGREDRDAALGRVMDWYLHAARNAAEHLPPVGRAFSAGPVPDGLALPEFDGPEEAVGWYEEELPNLMAAAHYAASRGWHGPAWRIPRMLASFFDFHVPGTAWAAVYRTAVEASRAAGEPYEEGSALNHLGWVNARLGRLGEAVGHYDEALAVARRIGDRDLEGDVLVNLGAAYFRLGRLEESTGCYGQALAIARDSGDRHLEAEALNDVAHNDNELGRHAEALAGAHTALGIYTGLDDRYRRGEALRALGAAHAGLGRPGEAAGLFLDALELMREFEDRRGEADVLSRLGDALHGSGDLGGAQERWREAAEILTELDDERADALRRRLAETGPRSPVPAGTEEGRR
ncbi:MULTISPECIES: AfsR/SARP family transcriptional regulator [Streptosporangium]|uniref:DNA-binding SARP family transcriptional activator/tetratricopeptide (TPR) repeat protein n=1 Tax=Streptosporangium brasiliense TaxID=47480 RepID=A0ABT9RE91_9ACTN|nr:BTAD domain-containing putative transcriptional regulator [Streptosporangium brasiliense]MDP9867581.1 DNA-binding SARP family transcriptional activator/tetratricopeptide (TPR) repeat protein [Streptosporangium brasiliense]